MNEDETTAYTTAAQLYNKELDRLFQRVNFFLIGSSFLIVAFVTLLKGSPHIFYMVIGAGLGLSIFFTGTNFFMSRFLARMLEYLNELETTRTAKSLCPQRMFPYHRTKEIGEKLGGLGCCKLACEFSSHLCQAFRRASGRKLKEKPVLVAEHTWLVPFGFIHFWWVATLLSVLIR